MRRACDRCGVQYEAKTSRSKFCGSSCRARVAEGAPLGGKPSGGVKSKRPSTAVADALRAELLELEVADSYEGRVALGLAAQLDNGTVVGAAYVSLSKELDRRVDALRLKAEKADDPARVLKDRLAEKRAHLA